MVSSFFIVIQLISGNQYNFWIINNNIALKSSHRRCSIRKAVLKNLAIIIEKYLCWNLLLINLQAYKPVTILQRDCNTGVFL